MPLVKQPLRISLIVTVLNEAATIEKLLDSIAQQHRLPNEVIICDGGSQDGTVQILGDLKAKFSKLSLKIMEFPGNRSQGRNQAIQAAAYDWLAVTDAGCVLHPDWLRQLEQAVPVAGRRSSTTVVAGYYAGLANSPFTAAVIPYALVMPDQIDHHNFLPATRSMLMAKNVWQELGGFDESLSDNEDYAFARKLISLRGVQLLFCEQAVVYWSPPSNIWAFAKMIFRFARGDAAARLYRPKVILIYLRYLLALILAWQMLSVWQLSVTSFILIFATLGMIYLGWAVRKNYRYAPSGWGWLPVLQLTSDLAVMTGSLSGLLKGLDQGHSKTRWDR